MIALVGISIAVIAIVTAVRMRARVKLRTGTASRQRDVYVPPDEPWTSISGWHSLASSDREDSFGDDFTGFDQFRRQQRRRGPR